MEERESDSPREREKMADVRHGGCCPPMDLFRSEPMQLVQLIIPMESAHLTVSYLGDLGLIQFKDVCTSILYYFLCFNLLSQSLFIVNPRSLVC